MTDQKLVDELEKALRDEAYDGGFGYMGDEQFTAYVRTLAETAAEVFEKALTPTDDERAIAVCIEIASTVYGDYDDAQGALSDIHMMLAPIAPGFRRSEVPEPSTDRVADGVRRALAQHGHRFSLNAADERDLGAIILSTIGSTSEPQGEPSDAQVPIWERPEAVEAARLAYQEAFEADYNAEDCIVAALRAAGVRGAR